MQAINLTIAVFGVMIAIPSALTSWRDYRHGRLHSVSQFHRATVGALDQGTVTVGHHSNYWPPPSATVTALSAVDVQSVSVPRRFLSYAIDTYSTILICGFAALLLGGGDPYAEDSIAGFLLLASPFVLAWANASSGRSIGKLLVGGRLVVVDGDGVATGTPGYGRALGRLLVSSVFNCLFISMFAALGREDRRTLHDVATKTQVIRTR